MWIEYSHIDVCALKRSIPELICCNVQLSAILNIAHKLFTIDGLEIWLNADVVADL